MLTCSAIGNLVRDPNIVEGQQWPKTEFTLAANTSRKDKDGKRISEFIKVSVIGTSAKYAAGLKKGDLVYVAGDITSYAYVGKDNLPHTLINLSSNSIQALNRGTAPKAQESGSTGTEDDLPF